MRIRKKKEKEEKENIQKCSKWTVECESMKKAALCR
jgi:hypothetical protein